MSNIISYLFETNAIRFCEENKPFWYTSGKIADIVVFNPNEEYVYTKDMIVSKSKNSPFIDRKLKGKVKYTLVNGKVVYKG